MKTAAMNAELTAKPCIGNYPQVSAGPATHIIFTVVGKPFPKTDPLPIDFTSQPVDHPAFAVFAGDIEEPPLVAPLLAAAATGDALPDLPEIDPSAPEIAPFLLSARSQRRTDDKPLLKDVGRDFNDLPAEVALLQACMVEPVATLRRISDDINPEIFYSERNRAIFLAILYLTEQGQTVSPASVLGHLKDTDSSFGSDHVSYVDQIGAVRIDPDHTEAYAGRLMRAARVRGGDPVGSFVTDRCVFHPDAFVTKRELFDAFDSWCQQHGLASGEKMENFFWKTLRSRHDLRDIKVAVIKGSKRENCLGGIDLRLDPDLD